MNNNISGDFDRLNEEKAKEIANDETVYGNTEENSKIDECFISALVMARFKDNHPISKLGGWHTEPPTEDCTVLLYITEQTLTVSNWNNSNKMFYETVSMYSKPIKKWIKWKRI